MVMLEAFQRIEVYLKAAEGAKPQISNSCHSERLVKLLQLKNPRTAYESQEKLDRSTDTAKNEPYLFTLHT